jgi:uncharacterized protein involved in exopolysaccharide biosynthesis
LAKLLRPPIAPRARDGDINLLVTVFDHRYYIIAGALVGVSLAIVLAVVTPRTYTARAAFIAASSSSGQHGVMGLAAQFGIMLGGDGEEASSYFLSRLAGSTRVLRRVVETSPSMAGLSRHRGGLIDYWSISAPTREESLERAMTRLKRSIRVDHDRQTGMVSVAVRDRSPEVAHGLVVSVLATVDSVNIATRKGRAAAQRVFLSERVEVAADELRESENRIRQFLESNREFRSSPSLTFELESMNRDALLRQEVLNTLRKGLEQARIEEVRSTPGMGVVEYPEVPATPDSRGLLVRLALLCTFGMAVAFAFGLFRAAFTAGE